MTALTWSAVNALRIRRHGLDRPGSAGPVAAATTARRMCGIHAQILSAAELSVGIRLDGATKGAVRSALWQERELIKTFGPRGTVHLLATEDLPWWSAALADIPSPPSRFAPGVQLDEVQTASVVEAVGAALADSELTLDELDAAVTQRAGPWAGERVMPAFQVLWPRWRQVIATAARRGALCFGPERGRTVTYTHPRRWAGDQPAIDPVEATGRLLAEFLRAYGPADPATFARWVGSPATWAQTVFDRAGESIEPVSLDGRPLWRNTGDEYPDDQATGVRLLPYFDAFVVGSHPREMLFPGRAGQRALANGQAGNFPVLLIDGTVAGVWHLRRSGRRSAITVEPLGRLTRSQRGALDERVVEIGRLTGTEPSVTIGTVTVGPHA